MRANWTSWAGTSLISFNRTKSFFIGNVQNLFVINQIMWQVRFVHYIIVHSLYVIILGNLALL